MRAFAVATAIAGAVLWTDARAFDFAISNFKLVGNGLVALDDTFASTTPPAAPRLSYDVTGHFSPAVGGRLHLDSASAVLSGPPGANSIGATFLTDTNPANLTIGIKPAKTYEVSGIWDAITPPDGALAAYYIELGDWDAGLNCECMRLGIWRSTDGSVSIRYWRASTTNNVITNTVISSVPFVPGANQQIMFKLSKTSASFNTVTASYAWVNNGVAGPDTVLAGSMELFTVRGYALAAFRAVGYPPGTAAPSAGTTATSVDPSTPLPPPPTVQTVYTVPTGQLPTAAVLVSPTGTFGNATLVVTLDLSQVLAGGSFAGLGQFAAGYSIYDAALVPSGVLGLTSATWFVLPATHSWALLSIPIAPYMEGLAQNATNTVEINILQGMDVTGLVGSEIYIGYGTSDTEMLTAGRYRGVYKVQ